MLQLGLALDDVLCARCAAPQWLEHPTLRDSVTILSRCGLNFVACIFFVLHSQAVSWELIVDIASAGELAAVAASGYMACLAHEPVTAGRLLPLSYTLVALLFQIVACLQDAGAIAWRPAAVFAPLWLLALTVLGAACVFASFRCGEIGNEMRSARVDLRLQRQRLADAQARAAPASVLERLEERLLFLRNEQRGHLPPSADQALALMQHDKGSGAAANGSRSVSRAKMTPPQLPQAGLVD